MYGFQTKSEMKKYKPIKCEICGEEVYKEYWQGKIMVREVRFEENGITTSPHHCKLSFAKENK